MTKIDTTATPTPEEMADILEGLSYSFSSPEASYFYDCVLNNDIKKARKILKEHVEDKNTVEHIIRHYQSEIAQPLELVSISVADIPREETEQAYLVKYGTSLQTTQIYKQQDKWTFFVGKGFLEIDKAQQVWLIKKI